MSRPLRGGWTAALPVAALATVALAGCGPADQARGAPFSFGAATCHGDPTNWRLSDLPIVALPPSDSLYRLTGVVLDSQDRLWISSGATNRIEVFSATGEHLRTVGRQGEGPGEYSFLNALYSYRGDSIAAFDGGLMRASVLDLDGELGRVVPAGRDVPNAYLFGTGPAGELLVEGEWMSFGDGALRDTGYVELLPAGAETSPTNPLRLPSGYSYAITVRGRETAGQIPFTPRATFAVAGTTLVGGTTDTPSLAVFRLPDLHRRDVDFDCVPARVADEVGAYRAHEVERANDPIWRRAVLDAVRYPEQVPIWSMLAGDPEGFVWIGVSPTVRTASTIEDWLAIDLETGEIAGRVEVPEGFYVAWIDRDRLAGIRYDDLGLEHVEVYQLIR